MNEYLDQLREIAQNATPGPWSADVGVRGDCVVFGPNGRFLLNAQAEPHWLEYPGETRSVAFDVDRRDCTHIATFDPPTVLDLIERVEAAERALDFHAQRDRELKTLLSVLSDRLDEFCYDELASLIEDEPLNQWGETYKSKLQTAEQAVERAKAVDALQRRDKGALYRRAVAAEAAVQRVRDAVKDAPTSDPTSGRTGPPDDWPDDGELIGQGEFLVAERVRRALDGGEQE